MIIITDHFSITSPSERHTHVRVSFNVQHSMIPWPRIYSTSSGLALLYANASHRYFYAHQPSHFSSYHIASSPAPISMPSGRGELSVSEPFVDHLRFYAAYGDPRQ